MSAPSTNLHDDLRVFRLDEVAERLQVSIDTVERLIDAGELRTVRPAAGAGSSRSLRRRCARTSTVTDEPRLAVSQDRRRTSSVPLGRHAGLRSTRL